MEIVESSVPNNGTDIPYYGTCIPNNGTDVPYYGTEISVRLIAIFISMKDIVYIVYGTWYGEDAVPPNNSNLWLITKYLLPLHHPEARMACLPLLERVV